MDNGHAPLPAASAASPGQGHRVAVIGGGWAGCAAAVELARRGCTVSLYEAARTLGGRARSVTLNGLELDNGQHILLGAYRETLRLLRRLEIAPEQAMLRLPLQMRYAPHDDGMDFVVPRVPAPLHLLLGMLRARGLAREDKLSLARFSTTARWMGWLLHQDCSVAELLVRFDQSERLTRLMWRPLCIAALNTPPERASAQVFLNVLRDSLGARRAASDMLLPKLDLTRLLPLRAAAFVERHGGSVLTGTTIRRIESDGSRWRLHATAAGAETETTPFDAVVVATSPAQAIGLIDGLADTARLTALAHEPISTCYLKYPETLRLRHPFLALLDRPEQGGWGQFVFDRGALDHRPAGLLAVVISASSEAIAVGQQALTASIARQLAAALHLPELEHPQWSRLITEKRATFSCAPGLVRPENRTGRRGLVLAGDYTAGDYPATLESAVRSGMGAACDLLGDEAAGPGDA